MAAVVSFEQQLFDRQLKERELAMKEQEARARLLTMTPLDMAADPVVQTILQQLQVIGEAVSRLAAPKVFERDSSGRVVSINGVPVVRDHNGLVAGVGGMVRDDDMAEAVGE